MFGELFLYSRSHFACFYNFFILLNIDQSFSVVSAMTLLITPYITTVI